MELEWNAAKAAANLTKHAIAFEDASRVFLDPHRLVRSDERRDYGEQRDQILGRVDGVVLLVVCTWRGESCRIISARRANVRERRRYQASGA